jgi:hypothetical protein
MYNYQSGPINHFLVDTFGLFTVQNAPQWLGGTSLTLPSIAVDGSLVGPRLPHDLLPRRPRGDSQGSAGRGAHRRRQRVAGVLAYHAAAARPDHDDPGRPALRHGDGGDRRISHLRRLQPRLADLHLDDLHVRPGVQDRALAPGLRRRHRHDRRRRHDVRHGASLRIFRPKG